MILVIQAISLAVSVLNAAYENGEFSTDESDPCAYSEADYLRIRGGLRIAQQTLINRRSTRAALSRSEK